jgi:glycerophosphoryl diester phosphodiesterase
VAVLNIAHRGARSLAPENTLAAARRALALGADLWETDVAVSRDGELVLLHDDLLVRTTDVRARFPARAGEPFTTFSLAELRTLDAGSWFGGADPHGAVAAGEVSPAELDSYRGERIPTLLEALRFTQENGWRINVELKRLPSPHRDFPVVDRVLAEAERAGIEPGRLILSSIRHDWLDEVRRRRPELEVQALLGLLPGDPTDVGDGRFRTYNLRWTLSSPEQVRSLVRRGHAVNLYTVNEPEDMRRFIEAGASGLITDFPQRLKVLVP